MVLFLTIVSAAFLLFIYAAFRRSDTRNFDSFVSAWLLSLTAWPIIVIYCLAPLIWSDAEDVGATYALIVYAPAALMSVAATASGFLRPQIVVDRAAVLIAGLMVYGGVAMLFDGAGRYINLGMAIILFLGFVFRGRSITIEQVGAAARLALVITVASLLAIAVARPDQVIGGCRIDKCTDVGTALTSTFAGNGNLAGIMVTCLLPFAAYGVSLAQVIALVAGVGAMGVLAGSRTAFIGIGLAAVLVLLLSANTPVQVRRAGLCIGVIGCLALSLLPFYVGYSETDYSLRGFLWNEARRLIPDELVFGHNPVFWVDAGRSLLFKANYSPHNGWLEIVLSVGVFGAVVIVLAAIIKIRDVQPPAREYLVVYFCTILCVSSLEAIYVPYFLGIAPFAAMLPFLVFNEGPRVMPVESSDVGPAVIKENV
jgi:hypothetical protein